jgi:hypothetical protein
MRERIMELDKSQCLIQQMLGSDLHISVEDVMHKLGEHDKEQRMNFITWLYFTTQDFLMRVSSI